MINTASINGRRDSNLELFRIITMLLIVAHHYVVLSGLPPILRAHPLELQSLYLFVFGGWGKTGINCFVFITGYFMCISHITLRKFVKLVAEVEFYALLFYFLLLIGGVYHFTLKGFLVQFRPIYSLSSDHFVSCYLLFFLFIPFLNKLLEVLSRRQHAVIILLLLFAYTFLGSIPGVSVPHNYLSWFSVIYLVGAYVRFYPDTPLIRTHLGIKAAFFVALSIASIIVCTFLGAGEKIPMPMGKAFFFVADSNKVLAFLASLFLFCFFKNLKISYSPFINMVGASTFGVLLIHSNSWAMRNLLWIKIFDNAGFYGTHWMYLHAVLTVLVVFAVCVLIDHFRIVFIERPFMDWYDRHSSLIESFLLNVEDTLLLAMGCSKERASGDDRK